MSKKPEKTEVETTGHSWDGIEEYNNPLPRWWLWIFYATIVWGIGYTIAYPAWPMINSATQGMFGTGPAGDTRLALHADILLYEEANRDVREQLVAADLTEVSADERLNGFATRAGGAIYRTWCAQCHGAGAAGAKGYPNLLDDDWLWGGSIEEVHYTITHGIRNEDSPDAHYSEMPAFGEWMEETEIDAVVNYVLSLSDQPHDAALVDAGQTVYMDNCSSCHADDATGDIYQGAPNLADAIWLYGGRPEDIKETVTYARFGVMPNWNTRLSEAEIRAVALYVHGLGGGQ